MLNAQLSLGSDNGNERAKLPVIGSSGITQQNGNYSITQGVDFAIAGRELFISNDSTSQNITFTVTCDGGTLSFFLSPGDTFNERLPMFTLVNVTASDVWRWYVRGNVS